MLKASTTEDPLTLHMTIKAMIVDDEPFVREDLRHMLARHPEIEVKWETAKMEEAQRLLAAHCPDVIFLDIDLRGGLGLDLIVHIDNHKTSVILMSGYNGYVERTLKYGVLACLSKPVADSNLAQSIEKLKHILAFKKQTGNLLKELILKH